MADRPLELVIIDYRILDARTDDGNFRRPVFISAFDVATRMPLSCFVSSEPPTMNMVLDFIRGISRTVAYAVQNLPEIFGAWDVRGYPQTVVVDRGLEFTQPGLQEALGELGIETRWGPANFPEFKALSEKFFRAAYRQHSGALRPPLKG